MPSSRYRWLRSTVRPSSETVLPARVGRVAVWAQDDSRVAQELVDAGNRVLVLDPLMNDPLRHGRLAGAGPYSVIVDAAGMAEGAGDRFRTSFLHLEPGGRYRVPVDQRSTVEAVTRLVDSSQPTRRSRPAGRALADAVDHVERRDGWLEVVRRGRTLAKLREPEMNAALQADPGRGRVLVTWPGAVLESRCAIAESRPRLRERAKPRFDAPKLFLREYYDVICRTKSVVMQRGLLTPDTFRHHQAKELRHKRLRNVAPGFAAIPGRRKVTRLEGTYFHLDNEIRGFFGHALTEQVSRLWGWPLARERYPDARVLVSLNNGRPLADWEWSLLAAGGIDREDVVVVGHPVIVERLLAATPMFSMPHYVHPDVVPVWDRVGEALRRSATPRAYPRRIFCSRRHDKRACVNRAAVEDVFSRHDFEIVFPEDHPLADQAALFHEADVVAGFAGSGMFTVMFTDRPKHLVLVSSDTYGASNEYMIAAVRGHRLDVAVGTSLEAPEGGSPPFALDLATDGAWLEDVLGAL